MPTSSRRLRTPVFSNTLLFILTPGGFDEMVMEMSEPAGSRTLPPPSEEEPDWERIAAIAKASGNELLA